MKRQTRRSLANIGVVVATIGVLALGLFFTYQIIAMAYRSSDNTASSSSASDSSASAVPSDASSSTSDGTATDTDPLTVRAQQIVGTMPEFLRGLFVFQTPFDGAFRGDFAILAMMSLIADWAFCRIASSLR